MRRWVLLWLCGALVLVGCSSLLPRTRETMPSGWKSFEQAMQSYDAIEPYRTDTAQLQPLGFDAGTNPNVRILSYLEVLERFLPSQLLTREDLAPGLLDCLTAGELCRAFEVNQRRTNNRRYGNFFADFLNFRRKTETTGWEFNAVIVLRENLVIYKIWSGQPQILTHEESTNPLGPLQSVGPSLFRY